MENLRRILNASWRLERWITWILHQSPNNTLAAALIDEVFKSSISHHLLFLSHLSRPSPIMAKETLCCVCRSDGRWPTEKFQSAGGKAGVEGGEAGGTWSLDSKRDDNLAPFYHNLFTALVMSGRLSLTKLHNSTNSPSAIDCKSALNNNNIDKNGTLVLTFDLISRPFLYLVMYSIS